MSVVRPNVTYALQPIRFYSVETSPVENTAETTVTDGTNDKTVTDGEVDKLYKRLEIELRGHDKMVLKSYVQFAVTAAEHLNIDVGKWY